MKPLVRTGSPSAVPVYFCSLRHGCLYACPCRVSTSLRPGRHDPSRGWAGGALAQHREAEIRRITYASDCLRTLWEAAPARDLLAHVHRVGAGTPDRPMRQRGGGLHARSERPTSGSTLTLAKPY